MPPQTETLTPTIKIDGSPLATTFLEALIELRIERGFQVPSRCSLRFLDPEYKLLQDSWIKLGSEVKISWGADPLVNVEVTGISIEHLPTENPELVVVGHDVSHRLARGTKVKTYQKMTYSAIVNQVVGGVSIACDVDSTPQQYEYTLQTDSDLGFITELANRVGYDWWVDESKTLHFKKPVAGAEVALDQTSLLSFSVKATGHRPDSYEVLGWDKVQQAAAKSDTKAVSGASLKAQSTLADKVGSTPFPSATLFATSVEADTIAEANELATSMQTKGAAASVLAKGVAVGNAALKPGAKVKVENFGPLSGTYHVTEVEHIYGTLGLTTRFTAGDRNPTSLVDVLTNGHTPLNTTFGHSTLAVGIVTSLNDPDNKNRVRVKFPGLSDENESAWGRVVALGGGDKRGMVFIPEVGDEVLVGFENGDVRQPVILGGLFSTKSATPAWNVENGKVTARRISSRLGHYLELGDGEQPTAQHLLLMLEGDKHKLRLGKDRFDIELPQGKPLSIKIGDSSIAIADNGDMTLQAPNINLKAKLKVAIEASSVDIQGKSTINVAANGKTGISGATVAVEAKATTSIKGNAGVQIN